MNDRSWTCSYFGWTWTECTVLCLMNIIVNTFILGYVNGNLLQFNFAKKRVPDFQSIPGKNPANTHHRQALICSGKTPNLATPATTESHRRMDHQQNEGSSTLALPPLLIWHLHDYLKQFMKRSVMIQVGKIWPLWVNFTRRVSATASQNWSSTIQITLTAYSSSSAVFIF